MKLAMSLTAVLVFAVAIVADTVVLKDGRKYEGVVVEESDTQVKIKTAKALLTFKREEVESIEKGESPVTARETRLAACTPDNPKAYLEAAEWLMGEGKALADGKTLIRICNVASHLDASLASRAQTLLGQYHMAKGEKEAAGWAYSRALIADPANEEAKKAVDGVRKMMTDKAIKQMREIQTAVTYFIDGKTKEAIPALRKCSKLYYADEAPKLMGMTVDELADKLQKLIACETCKGAMRAKCTPCEGTGIIRCEYCKGTGTKAKPGNTFAKEVCSWCMRAGNFLCQSCGAERTATIHFVDEYKGENKKTVKLVAGLEELGFKQVISTKSWTRREDGHLVTAIKYGGVTKGGMRTCPDCNGVPYEPATQMPSKDSVAKYRDEVAARVSGATPFDVLAGDGKMYDEAAIADREFRYEDGDWVK